MQRTWLFLAALALRYWNDVKRISDIQMQIAPAQRIDFTAAQTCVQREQIERSSRACKQSANIMGMRGLSMRRLDQILNLRQRCQSYAKLEDRYYGTSLEPGFKQENYNPPDSTRDERPDACPLLLERSNRIRKQRVNQAAHLILAEALGMELKSPEEVKDKKARKAEVDLHGEYKRRKDKHGKEYPRCSVIVLENLERYKMSQERTRSENSRLMQWAHRAIIEKLEDMCRPFGITLMLVDPAFSSHFDSRTGLPGVRVNEVPRSFEKQYPYAKWVNDKTKFGGETKLAKDIKKLAAQFEAHKDYSGKLALAVEGGTDFVPVLAPLGGKDAFNADIGAAGNIGLRAIADPQRWDIFSRLRTKKVSETEVRVTNWRGWFGKLPAEERLMRAAGVDAIGADVKSSTQTEARKKGKKKSAANPDGKNSGDNADSESGQSSEYPPYFVQHPQYEWLAENDLTKETFVFNQNGLKLHAYHQGAYLKKVEEKCALRITEINRARIEKSERGSDNIPM
jgi:IS605 OrfB family transposase